MKIIFLCGSLEPGRDGVGDYTRRLSAEIIRQGNEVSIIALNDLQSTEILNEKQVSEGISIDVLRIPNNTPSKIRIQKVQDFINDYNPEWLSLQYVPFSFQEKGLPFGLGSQLSKIGKGKKWHIMFHELWVGMDKEAPLKHFFWGKAQQMIVKDLNSKLRPQAIHTQSIMYQAQLNRLGLFPNHLPLFGNIPVVGIKNNELNKNNKTLSFVVFGLIHHGAPIKKFISELVAYEKTNQVKTQLIFIGRCGTELDNWVNACKEALIEVKVLGEQDPATISEVLINADWGISSTPMFQIQKSGTVAAMFEHGLKVICVARNWTPSHLKISSSIEGVVEYKENKLETILKDRDANQLKIFLKNIANDLVYDLDQYK